MGHSLRRLSLKERYGGNVVAAPKEETEGDVSARFVVALA